MSNETEADLQATKERDDARLARLKDFAEFKRLLQLFTGCSLAQAAFGDVPPIEATADRFAVAVYDGVAPGYARAMQAGAVGKKQRPTAGGLPLGIPPGFPKKG